MADTRISREILKNQKNSLLDGERGMIYLKIINANMKITSQTIRYSFWAMLGVIIVLTNLTPIHAIPTLQENTTTPVAKSSTTATPGTKNEAGSTDGIMIVALVIVLIVIIPILLKRQAWENGKKNKTVPPS